MLLEAEQVETRARRALRSSPIYSLRRVSVEQVDDVLHLSGTLDSFYLKQLAQEAVRAVSDGLQVRNEIDVCSQ